MPLLYDRRIFRFLNELPTVLMIVIVIIGDRETVRSLSNRIACQVLDPVWMRE